MTNTYCEHNKPLILCDICYIPTHTCSPDKALMRVVEKTRRMTPEEEEQLFRGFEYYEVIQTICPCGKVLSSNEIK